MVWYYRYTNDHDIGNNNFTDYRQVQSPSVHAKMGQSSFTICNILNRLNPVRLKQEYFFLNEIKYIQVFVL